MSVLPLVLGLLLFLGVHSIRIVADGWRTRQLARLGMMRWKGLYSLISVLGLALIIWGYGRSRMSPDLWQPPFWTLHLAAPLTLLAFILIFAAYVPRNHIKQWVGHPMLASVVLWALGHLLANGRLGAVLLFGGFLLWAALDFVVMRRRDRAAGTVYPTGMVVMDGLTVLVGALVWAWFAFYGHVWLIGVRPVL
jgi:uncharacterized membrane protein